MKDSYVFVLLMAAVLTAIFFASFKIF